MRANPEDLLELRGIAKSFGRRSLLRGIALEVRAGEYLAVMGESGVGKSTLLNIIAGLEPPDAGSVVFEGRELTRLDDDQLTLLRRRRMGFVFQAFHVLPYLTVAENVALPLLLNGVPRREADGRVAELLAAVGLGDRARSRTAELSGGESQRVALARALAHRPRLLLADEPTGNLDADSGRQVLELLRRCTKDQAASVVMVTHSAEAAAVADRVLHLTADGLITP